MKKLYLWSQGHIVAILLAFFVGIISIAPQIVFIYSPNSNYQGIPILATANEDAYLSRMKEIVDGHGTVASPWFYEYKDTSALLPPTAEWIWVIAGKVFFLSVAQTAVLMKFLMPAILFFLVYYFVYSLIGTPNIYTTITSIAAALMVTLGYDLIDYRSVIQVAMGSIKAPTFTLWTRPINPIFGGVIIFSFLNVIWSHFNKPRVWKLLFAGVLLALGVGTYFFTWSLILSIIGVSVIIFLLLRRFTDVKSLLSVLSVGILLSLPYIYFVIRTSQHPWYQESSVRAAILEGDELVINKMLIAALIIFLILSWKFLKRKRALKEKIDLWWWFCLSLLLAGLWALNQQVLTGVPIWPPHFVQYTIPLSIVVLLVIAHKIILPFSKHVWFFIVALAIIFSSWYGIFTQAATYLGNFHEYKNIQDIMPAYNWFNNNSQKDSVILTIADNLNDNGFITIFTHNNVYLTGNVPTLMPVSRIAHNYMVDLKLRGIQPEDLAEFIENNIIDYKSYFGGLADLKGVHSTEVYKQNKDIVPNEYLNFYNNDLYLELKKYRLDYILSDKALREPLLSELADVDLLTEINGYYIYQFNS